MNLHLNPAGISPPGENVVIDHNPEEGVVTEHHLGIVPNPGKEDINTLIVRRQPRSEPLVVPLEVAVMQLIQDLTVPNPGTEDSSPLAVRRPPMSEPLVVPLEIELVQHIQDLVVQYHLIRKPPGVVM